MHSAWISEISAVHQLTEVAEDRFLKLSLLLSQLLPRALAVLGTWKTFDLFTQRYQVLTLKMAPV